MWSLMMCGKLVETTHWRICVILISPWALRTTCLCQMLACANTLGVVSVSRTITISVQLIALITSGGAWMTASMTRNGVVYVWDVWWLGVGVVVVLHVWLMFGITLDIWISGQQPRGSTFHAVGVRWVLVPIAKHAILTMVLPVLWVAIAIILWNPVDYAGHSTMSEVWDAHVYDWRPMTEGLGVLSDIVWCVDRRALWNAGDVVWCGIVQSLVNGVIGVITKSSARNIVARWKSSGSMSGTGRWSTLAKCPQRWTEDILLLDSWNALAACCHQWMPYLMAWCEWLWCKLMALRVTITMAHIEWLVANATVK